MTKFKDGVIKIVTLIPKGKVVSYGQVALYLGMPRAAREVGWILNGLESNSPIAWWRVVNNKGYLSIKGSIYTPEEQKQLLMQEGVEVNNDYTFDIEKYRFMPNKEFINNLELDKDYLESVADKIPYSSNFHS